MEREEFERLIDEVVNLQQTHPCGGNLPGGSAAMKKLAQDLAQVRAKLARPPGEHCFGVVLLHPPAPPWLGLELLRLCEVSAGETCQLHPRSPVYNAGLLFGQLRCPGRLEAGERGVLGVAGLSGLGDGQFDRLRAHLEAWWYKRPDEARYHLVMTAQEHPNIVAAAQAAGLGVVRIASLADRPEDFPHVLHAFALQHHGSLGDFDADAFRLLASRRWDGDLWELDEVVHRVYSEDGWSDFSVDVKRVRESLRAPLTPEAVPESGTLWEQVQRECRSCDERTTELVGAPFFVPASNEPNPFDDPSPGGQFFRVISWAYQRFYEGANTNLRFLWAARQAACLVDVTETKRLYGFINRFRHHHQHHAPAGHRGPQDVQQWTLEVCGQESLSPWHREVCITAILVAILKLTSAIGRLLASVANENDEGRTQLIEQWRERLNLSWSPQRRRKFICSRLLTVAGWKVNPRPVADRWLNQVEEHLRGIRHIPEEKREAALTQWLDEQLKSDPDSQPLVRGDDLVDLGVPQTKRKELLEELQRAQLQGLSRDELLQLARSAAE